MIVTMSCYAMCSMLTTKRMWHGVRGTPTLSCLYLKSGPSLSLPWASGFPMEGVRLGTRAPDEPQLQYGKCILCTIAWKYVSRWNTF